MTTDPPNPELSVRQAAELLNVSVPYLMKLVEGGDIPGRQDGDATWFRRDDMLAYRTALREKCLRGLDELTALDQELGLYDPPPVREVSHDTPPSSAKATPDEILAPVRQGFAESGMTEGELTDLIEEVREEVWQEKQSRKFGT